MLLLIVGHLNINYLRNKFELLNPIIYNAFDIFLVLGTKIESPFPWLGIGCLDMIEIPLEEAYVYMSIKRNN